MLTLGVPVQPGPPAGPQDIVADMNSSTTKGKIEKDKREVRAGGLRVGWPRGEPQLSGVCATLRIWCVGRR